MSEPSLRHAEEIPPAIEPASVVGADRCGISIGVALKHIGGVALKVVLAVGIFGWYIIARFAAETGPRGVGVRNAAVVWQIERFLHLPSEVWLQRLVLPHSGLLVALNVYYTWVHFPLTLLFLTWLTLFRRESWARIWTAMSVTTLSCFVIDANFPVAPPRLFPSIGMVDTAVVYGPNIYGDATLGSVANQYGAMPSVHFAWSVFVAWGIITYTKSRWRWLSVAHPAMTLTTIVLTANHFWLDALVGLVLVFVGLGSHSLWSRLPLPRLHLSVRIAALVFFCLPSSLVAIVRLVALIPH